MDILPLFCEIDDFCKVFEKLYQRRALPGESVGAIARPV